VALETGESQAEPSSDFVHLMTMHAAKGLEFPFVFIGGVEEGLFPHQMSVQDLKQLEEKLDDLKGSNERLILEVNKPSARCHNTA